MTSNRLKWRSGFVLAVTYFWGGMLTDSATAGGVYVQTNVGSKHDVSTEFSFTTGGLFEWAFGPMYKLAGRVELDPPTAPPEADDYDEPWENKLIQFPIGATIVANGVNDSASRTVLNLGPSSGTVRSSITTQPRSLGIPLPGGPTLGQLVGVSAEMEVEVVIDPGDFLLHPGFSSFGQAFVHDPFPFTNFASDDRLSLRTQLRTGDSFSVRGNGGGFSTVLSATTDIPGMETLYRLEVLGIGTGSLNMNANDTDIEIDFIAHPNLSILENDVKSAILNGLTFNDQTSRFDLTSDITIFDGLIDVPDSVTDFNLYLTQTSTAVPEPTTLALCVIPCAVFFVRSRKQRTSSRISF